jgi:uncharacterized protein (TIRG00374 family)
VSTGTGAPARGARWRARATFWARALVAAGLLTLVVRRFGGSQGLAAGLASVPAAALIGAFAVNTADRLLMAWKWNLLLRARGPGLPNLKATRIYCASMVWGMFLPATVGADSIRAVSAVRSGLRTEPVLASILVERGVGFLASLVLGLLGLVAVWWLAELPAELRAAWWLGALLLLGGAAALAGSFSERVYRLFHDRLLHRFRENALARRLRALHESYRGYQAHGGLLAGFFALSMLEQLVPAAAVGCLVAGLGVAISPLYLAGAVALAFLVARVPVSLGGIGVMEGALVVLLTLGGVPDGEALAVTVLARLVEVASWLPWWLVFVLDRGTAARPREQSAH